MAAIDTQTAPSIAEQDSPFAAPAGLARRNRANRTFIYWGLLATVIALGTLTWLVIGLVAQGAPKLSWDFFTSFPSSRAADAGILSGLVGSLLVVVATALLAVPVGIMAGIYLEEYAAKNRFTDVIEVTVNNLAGVPSIVYGLLGLGFFMFQLGMSRNVLLAGMTLGLLILPFVIVTAREAVRCVPKSVREAALSVGATKWQATWDHVLPYSLPGIFTGVIIGVSRAIGETAPLIIIGVPTFIAYLPASPAPFGPSGWLNSDFTVMPMLMFNWTQRPDPAFQENAAAAGLVLLAVTLALNGIAFAMRYNARKKIRW